MRFGVLQPRCHHFGRLPRQLIQATQFHGATKTLKEYIIKSFVLDDAPSRCKSALSSLPTPHHTRNRCR